MIGLPTNNIELLTKICEPPVTSKYKPMIHQVKPQRVHHQKQIMMKKWITLEYSYGNVLQSLPIKK